MWFKVKCQVALHCAQQILMFGLRAATKPGGFEYYESALVYV